MPLQKPTSTQPFCYLVVCCSLLVVAVTSWWSLFIPDGLLLIPGGLLLVAGGVL